MNGEVSAQYVALILLSLTAASQCLLLYDTEGNGTSTGNASSDTEVQLMDSVLKTLKNISTVSSSSSSSSSSNSSSNSTDKDAAEMEFREILLKFMNSLPPLILTNVTSNATANGTDPGSNSTVNPMITTNFTYTLMQQILDTHNHMRMAIASGRVKGQPTAANMVLMEWDDRLAVKASNWSEKCIGAHDDPSARTIKGHTWVGQNLCAAWSFNIRSLMDLWYEEYAYYNYTFNECQPGKICGHYTQLIWAKSLTVGCWLQDCHAKLPYSALLVCNYAPGGNLQDSRPYSVGPGCSQCPGEFVCCSKKLCSTAHQVSLAQQQCNCTLSSSECKNNATFVPSSCSCRCAPGYYGNRCEHSCSDLSSMCAEMKEANTDFCMTDMSSMCLKTCNRCLTETMRDPNRENKWNIIARVLD